MKAYLFTSAVVSIAGFVACLGPAENEMEDQAGAIDDKQAGGEQRIVVTCGSSRRVAVQSKGVEIALAPGFGAILDVKDDRVTVTSPGKESVDHSKQGWADFTLANTGTATKRYAVDVTAPNSLRVTCRPIANESQPSGGTGKAFCKEGAPCLRADDAGTRSGYCSTANFVNVSDDSALGECFQPSSSQR
jgi:hypothetical protein